MLRNVQINTRRDSGCTSDVDMAAYDNRRDTHTYAHTQKTYVYYPPSAHINFSIGCSVKCELAASALLLAKH